MIALHDCIHEQRGLGSRWPRVLVVYGNFDIIDVHYARVSQLDFTPHALCAMPYFVAILIWC